MVVLRVLYEILDFRPDLVVSGINYGENVGDSITASGTVGAALEAATWGIPAIAVSRQIENLWDYLEHSENVDFSTAAYFTAYFARQLLQKKLPYDVDVLKVDVPIDATPQTPWRITRVARNRYYAEPGDKYKHTGGRLPITPADVPPDSDIAALLFDRVVSVTPLSVDLTSRVDFETLRELLSQ
jgi:5'-nucleotidase